MVLDRCASTNREAMAGGRAGAAHGALWVAEEQTGGRGRQGRAWSAAPGENLTFSLVLRPKLTPADAALVCFAAGAALAEVLDLRLKWPNDLLDAQDRKLAGMLAELELRGREIDFVVLGIGLNVNQRVFPPELPNPGSLALRDGEQDRTSLLCALVPAILARVDALPTGRAAVMQAWRARSATLGRPVRVGTLSGVAVDLADDGALMLRTAEGHTIVHTGDVELLG